MHHETRAVTCAYPFGEQVLGRSQGLPPTERVPASPGAGAGHKWCDRDGCEVIRLGSSVGRYCFHGCWRGR